MEAREVNPLGLTQGEEMEHLARQLARVERMPIAEARSKVRAEIQGARERSRAETVVEGRQPNPEEMNRRGLTLAEWLRQARWPAERPVTEAREAWQRGDSPLARRQNPVPLEPPTAEKTALAKLSNQELAAHHTEANDAIASNAHDPRARDHASRRACWALWEAERRGVALDRSVHRPAKARAAAARTTARTTRTAAVKVGYRGGSTMPAARKDNPVRSENPRGSDWRQLTRDLVTQGWRIEPTSKSHLKLFAPDGNCIVVASGTPSDYRALAKIKSDLRRCGYKEAGARAANPIDPSLHARIAKALGWSEADVTSMSLPALRDLVRPVDPKLAAEIGHVIASGSHVTRKGNPDPVCRKGPPSCHSSECPAVMGRGPCSCGFVAKPAVVCKWKRHAGSSTQAPSSSFGQYVISHREGQHTVSFRPPGEHIPVGVFETEQAAKDAAWRHYETVGQAYQAKTGIRVIVYSPELVVLKQFEVESAPLEQEIDLLLRVARTCDHGNIIQIDGPDMHKRVRVVKQDGRVGYQPEHAGQKGQTTMHAHPSRKTNPAALPGKLYEATVALRPNTADAWKRLEGHMASVTKEIRGHGIEATSAAAHPHRKTIAVRVAKGGNEATLSAVFELMRDSFARAKVSFAETPHFHVINTRKNPEVRHIPPGKAKGVVKCKWCTFTNKPDPAGVPANVLLREHVKREHPEEYAKLHPYVHAKSTRAPNPLAGGGKLYEAAVALSPNTSAAWKNLEKHTDTVAGELRSEGIEAVSVLAHPHRKTIAVRVAKKGNEKKLSAAFDRMGEHLSREKIVFAHSLTFHAISTRQNPTTGTTASRGPLPTDSRRLYEAHITPHPTSPEAWHALEADLKRLMPGPVASAGMKFVGVRVHPHRKTIAVVVDGVGNEKKLSALFKKGALKGDLVRFGFEPHFHIITRRKNPNAEKTFADLPIGAAFIYTTDPTTERVSPAKIKTGARKYRIEGDRQREHSNIDPRITVIHVHVRGTASRLLTKKFKQSMTLAEAKKILTPLGMVIKRTDPHENEWQVNFKGGGESSAAFESDIESAVGTGVAMSKHRAGRKGNTKHKGKARKGNPAIAGVHPVPGADRVGNTYQIVETKLGAYKPDIVWSVMKLAPSGHISQVGKEYKELGDAEIFAKELVKNRAVGDAKAIVIAHQAKRGAVKHGKALGGHISRLGAAALRHGKAAAAKAKAAHAKRAAAKRKANPAEKKPAKPKTDWSAKTLSEGDKAMIRMVMGNMHVSEPESVVIEKWQKRVGKKNIETPLARAVIEHALDCHWDNMRQYVAVMDRRELPKQRPTKQKVESARRGVPPSEEMVERAMAGDPEARRAITGEGPRDGNPIQPWTY